MSLLVFAGGSQLFVEPQVLLQASGGAIPTTWAPNQLAFLLAFNDGNVNEAAALSVDLLLIALIAAAVVIWRTGLFGVEE